MFEFVTLGARGTEGFDLHELSEGIENYFCDRERRNRLMHDEWYVSLLRGDAVPRTRGLPRKKDADVVWGESTPDDVWELAWRFRDYAYLFSHRIHVMRKAAATSEDDVESVEPPEDH